MAKAFLYGNGGGAGLNFKLKAYATEAALLADSPADGTFGVVTATEISGYAFVAATSEITSPATGMVAITEGTASPASYNALKKNMLNVYPTACYQYSGSSWLAKTCYVRIAGAWASLRNWLYNNGVNNDALIGGWTNQSKGTFTKNADNMFLYGANDAGASIVHGTALDLTTASVLKVKFSNTYTYSSSNCYCRMLVNSTQISGQAAYSTGAAYVNIADKTANTDAVASLNVSALTGTYYVHFGIAASTGNTMSVYIKELWTE
ncbi:MAG: hypothetical protein VB021_09935 [Oscillospiraceae bacterium]|nr:hypothetical protein [Oscillospiraceae bacterium]